MREAKRDAESQRQRYSLHELKLQLQLQLRGLPDLMTIGEQRFTGTISGIASQLLALAHRESALSVSRQREEWEMLKYNIAGIRATTTAGV